MLSKQNANRLGTIQKLTTSDGATNKVKPNSHL